MAVAIPADMLQFYGVALRLAQELSYLDGEGDLWDNDFLDRDRVTNTLILYCGVMLGASGAAQTVRVLSSALAKQALKRLPQQALTKTFYYPIIKSIAAFFGKSMTKTTFAKGISKAVPILGGVVSGGITFATMLPMGQRLADTLDMAHFDYSEEDFQKDWQDIIEVSDTETEKVDSASKIGKFKMSLPTFLNKSKSEDVKEKPSTLDEIMKAKEMLEAGILTQEEFDALKIKLISDMQHNHII